MMINLPAFYFGLPIVLQGIMFSFVLVLAMIALYAASAHYLKKAVANQRKVGATPIKKPVATATVESKADDALITDKNPSALRKHTAQPRVFTQDDEAFYDIPAIVRKESDCKTREKASEAMMPITKRLFGRSAEEMRLSLHACAFNAEHLDLNKRLFGLIGKPSIESTRSAYMAH